MLYALLSEEKITENVTMNGNYAYGQPILLMNSE